MGFRSKLLVFVVFIFFGSELRAQPSGLDTVDLNHIYNKWVLSGGESSFGNLVYRNEVFFTSNNSDNKPPTRWRFAEHSDVFINRPYSKVSIYKKEIRPRRPRRTCGQQVSDSRSISRVYYGPPKRTKGKWRLVDNGNKTKIELLYYQAEKGKPFKLSSTEVYEIVHLEKDLMVLRKE